MNPRGRKFGVLPGFGLTFGFSTAYLGLLVVFPLSMLFVKTAGISADALWQIVSSPRNLAALGLSFKAAFVSALLNAFFGLLLAWILVRYEFPFKKVVDAFVDLPFGLPTAVTGICFATIYSSHGPLGRYFYSLGIPSAYSQFGIILALTFIGLPFVVRTVQPVLQDLDVETEEAAMSLGANRRQTVFRVILPMLFPALLTGSAMSFARALGEYGSIVFISGNMPFKTEIVPLLIVTKLEQYDYAGATALACLMLVISFLLLIVLNALQAWTKKYERSARA
ncbi:MAG: sulfate ABC transporter permease subunit CysT [Candidatus Omnitrophica bacterium]|nr:sulfate ABC transporter permease subunit CysT [Candidatus Omnitrophota bacterium]